MTSSFHVGLVTRRSSPKCVWRTDRGSSGPFCSEPSIRHTTTLTSAVIISHTSLHGVCHCLITGSEHNACSDAISSNKALTLSSAKFAFRVLSSVWISIFIQEMKIAQEKSKSTRFVALRGKIQIPPSPPLPGVPSDTVSQCYCQFMPSLLYLLWLL